MAVAYGRVTREQRYTADDPCPGCGGYDSRRLGNARCWGVLTSNGQGFICTVASSGHPARNGDGWVHLYAGCDCGTDHIEQYRVDPLSRAASDAPVKVTRYWQTKVSELGQPEYTHAYGTNLRLLRWGTGEQKTLFWIHFDRDYGWVDGMGGYTAGFYRAEQIAAADARKPVYLAGGEKCVDELVKVGAVAGCNPHGEHGQLSAEWVELLRGRHIVILADADEKGRRHAHALADALTGVAASVRIIELEGAHDVADWLADGHTLLELLEITACMPVVQHSSPGMSSSAGGASDAKSACPNCKREHELRQIAEVSLANLRREDAMTKRIMALKKEQLSPPLKPAALAVREVLNQPKARDEQGMELCYRRAISQRCGVSDDTAGTYLRKLADAGIIRREVRKSFDTTEILISEGPLFDAPEQIAPTPVTWGGKRTKKGCPHCQSIDIVPTAYGCTNCGAHLRADELIDVLVDVEEAEPQEPAQDTPPPPDTIVPHLAPDAQESDADELRCPECGRGGDMLKDYGDGILRCRACDVPAVGWEAS